MKRYISDSFEEDLNFKEGQLSQLLEWVQNDKTLALFIREDYINIYYRGGVLFKVTGSTNDYKFIFDMNYFNTQNESLKAFMSDTRNRLEKAQKPADYVALISDLKQTIDFHLGQGKNEKAEREFQQLVARENNNSPVSNESEYFITDIEYTSGKDSKGDHTGRFDMLGIRWDANNRTKNTLSNWVPVFIEMKYGDGSIGGASGIKKHLADMCKIEPNAFKEMIKNQFNALKKIGLITVNQKAELESSTVTEKPELILLLANTNPRSAKLKEALLDLKHNSLNEQLFNDINNKFNLRIFQASLAGYAMHTKCMLTVDEFLSK